MSKFGFGGRRPQGPQQGYGSGNGRGSYGDDPYDRPFLNREQQGQHYPEDDQDPRLYGRRPQEEGDYYQERSPHFRNEPRQLSPHSGSYSTRQEDLRGLSFWQDEDTDTTDDPENWPDRPSPFKFVIAITGLVLLAGILWFAYRWVSQPSSEAPPLIQAEEGPFKVKPENPGGASIPHQDKLIYGRITPGQEQPVERLLPPPEQPVIQQQPAQAPAGYPTATAPAGQPQTSYVIIDPKTGVAQQVYVAPSGVAPAPVQPQAPEGYIYVPVPAGQNNQAQVTPGQAPQQGNYAYPPLPQPVQPHAPAAPVTSTMAVPSEAVALQAQEAAPVSSAPKAEEKATPKAKSVEKSSAPAAAGSGSFYLQLATLPNNDSAVTEAKRLGRKGELVDTTPFVRATSGPDVKYRVLAGPFSSKTEALSKCTKLGMSCRVVELAS